MLDNKTRPVRWDTLKPGDLVTVLSGISEEVAVETAGAPVALKTPEPYQALKGVPLEVAIVEFPYAICRLLPCSNCSPGDARRAIIDLRCAHLMRISENFAKAFAPAEPASTVDVTATVTLGPSVAGEVGGPPSAGSEPSP